MSNNGIPLKKRGSRNRRTEFRNPMNILVSNRMDYLLEAIAVDKGVSLSVICRRALTEYIHRETGEPIPTNEVSIRSPHKSKGRHLLRLIWGNDRNEFQSAPLTKARGDMRWPWLVSDVLGFQSAPLTKARGDSASFETEVTCNTFQSAPLTKARGDKD